MILDGLHSMAKWKPEYSIRARAKCLLAHRCINCGKPKERSLIQMCDTCSTNKSFITLLYVALLRTVVLDGYGNICSCCGATHSCFLGIDHINDDGSTERTVYKAAASFYNKIIEENFPSTYRILCHSCNLGRYFNGGICPHKESVHAHTS